MNNVVKLFVFSIFFYSFFAFSQDLIVKYRLTKENNPITDYELIIEKNYNLFYESGFCLRDVFEKTELVILKDVSPNIKIFDKADDAFISTIKPNKFNWIIKEEKRVIGSYTCQKAEVFYKNEKWIAWFTDKLPFQTGPFIFEGLPGLILSVENTKYKFDLLSINQGKSICDFQIDDKRKEISYEKYENLFKNVSEKNAALLKSLHDLNLTGETKSFGEKQKKLNILREIL